jgi:AraC-like DNA-binding protein
MKYLAMHEKAPRGSFDFPIQLYHVDSMTPRYEMPFHWHTECEFIRVISGGFSLSVDGELTGLEAGDSAFIPGGAVHGGVPRECVYECLVLDMERFFEGSTVVRGRLARIIGPDTYIPGRLERGSEAWKLTWRIFDAMSRENTGYEFITTGLLWQFVGTVLEQGLYVNPAGERTREGRRSEQIKNALRRIRDDYQKELTLGDLAGEAGLTPQYFCRVFRQITGRTPIDYLNYYRVECAAELLCSSNDSVMETALSCGFCDLTYFTRLFRRHKGMTPGQYRKEHAA